MKITKLTKAQEARFNEWADKWIEIGLRTGLADRPRFERAVRQCYEFANIPWHGRIVWITSPIALVIAAPVSALLIEFQRNKTLGDAVRGAVRDAVGDAVGGAVGDAVGGAVGGAVGDAVRGAVGDAVRGAVGDAVGGAVRGAVGDAVGGAVGDAVGGAVRDAVGDAVRGAVRDAVGDAVGGAVRDAVDDAVGDAVGGAVRDAVDGAVRDAVGGAVRDAVGDAVRGAVGDAVGGAVRDAVDDAVRGAVDDAVGDAVKKVIANGWMKYFGGQLWPGGYWWGPAFNSFFREVCSLELSENLWQRAIAYEETVQSACWWYPHRDFVIACERPSIIRRELVNPSVSRGAGSHRLHSENGPAIVWPDGWGVYAWHGVQVPRDWIERRESLTPLIALTWKNIEQRRAACELLGWTVVLDALNARVIDKNQSEYIGTLLEVDLPDSGKERFLKVKCGTGRLFAIPVPPDVKTALEANSWTYNINPNQLNPEVRT